MKKRLFFLICLLQILMFSCSKYPSQIKIKDSIQVKDDFLELSADNYGFYVLKPASFQKFEDLMKCELILIGETEENVGLNIALIGIGELKDCLFKSIKTYKINDNVSCEKGPCMLMKNSVKIEEYNIEIMKEDFIYGEGEDIGNLVRELINSENNRAVIFMKRTYSIGFNKQLSELIIE